VREGGGDARQARAPHERASRQQHEAAVVTGVVRVSQRVRHGQDRPQLVDLAVVARGLAHAKHHCSHSQRGVEGQPQQLQLVGRQRVALRRLQRLLRLVVRVLGSSSCAACLGSCRPARHAARVVGEGAREHWAAVGVGGEGNDGDGDAAVYGP